MEVYKEPCKNCLLSPDSIVSAKRRKEIIQKCVTTQSHFICHKASIEGKDICCSTFYERLGHACNLIRVMERINGIQFVEMPEHEKLKSHNELSK